ncbi:[Fe-Fe] hydrogenase large subunit C-terminal domain-containing protein [Clostridium tagluense]|uniref:[Fe-Fe] hydrogenase large subunit C-terminal domain-containing protein n=1 Tax=Clostridium tagluense TaxID=360422 RepID=UPI001C6EEFD6|nr:[Fe-Fe] hydrogenase large subunit C-terminal domain-containing protein [Clostridium tagluense]MBW9158176.1 PAS domain-containing protein [Clostridium tagluense]WLC67498.1 PAS domain S-box protein [Clostridium tagluense]
MSILKLKKANCKNCYKCIRNCPVKSIEVKDHQAQILERDCILCGNCILTCPQDAKEVRNDLEIAKNLVRGDKDIIASVAPSFIANYDVSTFEAFKDILKKLGFSDAYETAEGAFLVKSEYEQLIAKNTGKTIISSCCPTVVKLIQKHHPSTLENLAPVLSPMQAHGNLIKAKNPSAQVVFIGPCISKKDEIENYPGAVDMVLTFDELNQWLEDAQINITAMEDAPSLKYLSRLFPVAGGIIKTMNINTDYKYISVDGIDNCIDALIEVEEGNFENCFIEMSACNGSCVNGPARGKNKLKLINAQIKVEKLALNKETICDYDLNTDINLYKEIKSEEIVCLPPSKSDIAAILKKMGRNTLSDELNCGTCGYNTCREKAIAVYFGKAEITMCLPYMRSKAESFSDKIISATPNAILAVDMDLRIQQINRAACNIFGILKCEDVIGVPVSRIMDEFDFVNVISKEESRTHKKVYLAEYEKYIEELLVYDKNSHVVICIMKDITNKHLKREKLLASRNNAKNIADKILEKQIGIVHEIASLLGETTAETQVALKELENTMFEEDEY